MIHASFTMHIDHSYPNMDPTMDYAQVQDCFLLG